MAVISWNEYTENSYVEPSHNYGERYLAVLALLTGAAGPVNHAPTPTPGVAAVPTPTEQPSRISAAAAGAVGGTPPGRGSPSDLIVSVLIAGILLGLLGVVGYRLRSRGRATEEGPAAAEQMRPNGPDTLGRPIR